MSRRIKARLVLQCKRCQWRPPDDAVMEAVRLHFNVDHDTDNLEMDLVAVCECGATMGFQETRKTGGGFIDHFACQHCDTVATIKRGK